jgi:predicted RNA-binding protein with RPS1 domain
VIELNRSRNNVVLSRRAVLEEARREQREALLDRLQPGLVVEGQISNVVDFGAFVDLDGIDGLIHISELAWSHVNHPSEVLTIGQTVEVKVVEIDRERQRISLSLKATQPDPWQRFVDTYHVGDDLEGTVTKVVAFGAFVEVSDGVEGLVHVSELAQEHIENPREVVAPGDEVKVKLLEIDSERRRLSLSTKRVEGQVLPRAGARPSASIAVDDAFVLTGRSSGGEPVSREEFDTTWLSRFEDSQGRVAESLANEAREWLAQPEWDEDALAKALADLTDERVLFLLMLFDASEETWASAVAGVEQLIAKARAQEPLGADDLGPAGWCLHGMETSLTEPGMPADWRGAQLDTPRLAAARELYGELAASLEGARLRT